MKNSYCKRKFKTWTSLFLFLLISNFISAQGPTLVASCGVHDFTESDGDVRSLYTGDYFHTGLQNLYNWTGGSGLWELYSDGTAKMSGHVENIDDPVFGFDVEIWFQGPFDWTNWSALGRTYKTGGAVSILDEYLDWEFYTIDPSKASTLIGTGSNSGTLIVTHEPADYTYGGQVGYAANAQNNNFGVSLWFHYTGSLNGTFYDEKGDFNMNGGCLSGVPTCDDSEIAKWDVNPCVAGGTVGGVFYTGFEGDLGPAACPGTVASNLQRSIESNSCSYSRPGGDSSAFCSSQWEDAAYIAGDAKAITFDLTYAAGESGEISSLCFWEYAPRGYYYQTNGYSDWNDTPEKFGVRVLKDGAEVYRQTDITTASSWTERCFDFSTDADFSYLGPVTYTFELFAYDNLENGYSGEIWELDDIAINGSCGNCNAPVATDDSESVEEDTPKTIDLVANDFDLDGDLVPSSLFLISSPPSSEGVVFNNGDGTIAFGPASNYCGPVTPFAYEISDAAGTTVSATVNLIVNCVNDLPIATDDAETTFEDVSVTVNLSSNDTDIDDGIDAASLLILSNPPTSQGVVSNNGDGSIDFVPAPGFCGVVDAFDYQISDFSGEHSVATVSLTVTCINDAPIAGDDADAVCFAATTTTDVLVNDMDPEGSLDLNSIMVISGPAYGTTTVNPDGSITYMHNGTAVSADSYVYTVADMEGAVGTATVSITLYSNLNLSGTVSPSNNCGGVPTGAIDANVSGGTAPYTYSWSNGASTEDVSDLMAGTYLLDVTDANGCQSAQSFTVVEDDALQIADVVVIASTGCNVRDGGLIIDLEDTHAGLAPYFLVVNGSFTAGPFNSEPIVITGAPAGATATTIEIIDANSCTDMAAGPITIPGPGQPDILTVTTIDGDCDDAGGTLILDLDDATATPPYSIVLSPTGDLYGPFASEPISISDVPYGNYSRITLLDGLGCQDRYKTPFTLTEPTDCVECPFPSGAGTIVNGGKTADLYWNSVLQALGYEIRIRPGGLATWISIPATMDTVRRIGSLSHVTPYEWQVRSICGAELSDFSPTVNFTTLGAKLAEQSQASAVNLFPNPAVHTFAINYRTTQSEKLWVTVYNQIGQVVFTASEIAATGLNTFLVDCSDFPAGLYQVSVEGKDGVQNSKIVVGR